MKTIKEPYRRGWDILSYQYVEDCAKNQSLVDHTGSLLDVTVLQTLPSRSLYSVPVVDVQVIQQQTSFLATAKKRMREERHPVADISNCTPPENTRTHKKETFRTSTFQTSRDICYVRKGKHRCGHEGKPRT